MFLPGYPEDLVLSLKYVFPRFTLVRDHGSILLSVSRDLVINVTIIPVEKRAIQLSLTASGDGINTGLIHRVFDFVVW